MTRTGLSALRPPLRYETLLACPVRTFYVSPVRDALFGRLAFKRTNSLLFSRLLMAPEPRVLGWACLAASGGRRQRTRGQRPAHRSGARAARGARIPFARRLDAWRPCPPGSPGGRARDRRTHAERDDRARSFLLLALSRCGMHHRLGPGTPLLQLDRINWVDAVPSEF